MYRTAQELREHVTAVHTNIAGAHMPVFRCGFAGCQQCFRVCIQFFVGACTANGPSRVLKVWNTTFDRKLRLYMSFRTYLFTTSSTMVHSQDTKFKHPPVEPPVKSRQPLPITKLATGDQIRDLTSRVDSLLLDQTTFKNE